jgi:hypothetical protein
LRIGAGCLGAANLKLKKFFGSFFQKRTASFPSCLTPPNQFASMPGNCPRKPNPK